MKGLDEFEPPRAGPGKVLRRITGWSAPPRRHRWRLRQFGANLWFYGRLTLFAGTLTWLWLERERVGVWLEPAAARLTVRADDGDLYVKDGDSFILDGHELRLRHLDAPEYNQTCATANGTVWPCGQAARSELVALLGAPELTCGLTGRDRYGRSLAVCTTTRGDVATAMLRAGLALPPPGDASGARLAAVEAARAAQRGVWQGEHVHPAEWRRAAGESPAAEAEPDWRDTLAPLLERLGF